MLDQSQFDKHENRPPNSLGTDEILASPFNHVVHLPITAQCVIHDSTLREGEQAPGVALRVEDKLEIAGKLDEVGVQQIECGFPVASENQRKCAEAVAKMSLKATTYAFARAKIGDIDAVADTGVDGVIMSFSISNYHRTHKFNGMSKSQYLSRLPDFVSHAKERGLLVLYSAEDTTREEDIDFIKKAYRTAEIAGADRVRVVDTLGCASPQGMSHLVNEVKEAITLPIEVHCHNDMGLALANSLAAVESGALGISTAVNGLGERCGITATEEAILALHVLYGMDHFRLDLLTELSRLVADLTGVKVSPQKPITGENVFTHTSGIHQHGVFTDTRTYEFYPPWLVGQKRKVYLSELSGRHGVLHVAHEELGMEISEDTAMRVASRIKASFSRRKRRSPYGLDELRRLIEKTQGDISHGFNHNRENPCERI